MRTVKITIHCPVCGGFHKEMEVDTNEHGFFAVPTAYCPFCCCALEQVIHAETIRDIDAVTTCVKACHDKENQTP